MIDEAKQKLKELSIELEEIQEKYNELEEQYDYRGEQYDYVSEQLLIYEKALEMACEHIKEDLKCDYTEDEICDYFINKAKEELGNEQKNL